MKVLANFQRDHGAFSDAFRLTLCESMYKRNADGEIFRGINSICVRTWPLLTLANTRTLKTDTNVMINTLERVQKHQVQLEIL